MVIILADQPAGGTDIGIAGLVAEGVVDMLEAVHVADDDAEFPGLSAVDPVRHAAFLFHPGMLAADAGQGIPVGYIARLVALFFCLRLIFPEGEVVDQHGGEGQAEEADEDEDRPVVGGMDVIDLGGEEGFFIEGKGRGIRGSAVIRPDVPDDPGHRAVLHPTGPDQGHDDDQRQQGDPDDDGLAEAAGVILRDDPAEVEEPDDGPGDQQEVGLRFQRIVGEQVREEEIDGEAQHDDEPGQAGDLLFPVARCPGRLVRSGGNETVDQRGADRGDVHDPADGCPAQEGDRQGQEHDQAHGPGGDVPAVQPGEAGGQDAVPRNGIIEPAQRAEVPDEAGEDQREQGEHQDHDAGIAQVMLCGIEGGKGVVPFELIQAADIVQPAGTYRGIGGDAQERDKDIQQRGGDHGDHQDPVEPAAAEPELLR